MARIVIVSPSLPGAATGNAVTAERWRKILRSLGHTVSILPELGDERFDVVIALHATKSAASVKRAQGRGRIVVALTGTDLYQDLKRLRTPWRSLETADRIVLLQPLGLQELTPALRRKSVVIRQSATQTTGFKTSRRGKFFNVVVLSNLRQVKDPLRAAYASRKLPENSCIRVIHAGRALDKAWEERARSEMRKNPRYVWMGELPSARAGRLLIQSDLLVLSSRSEGGANVLSEAIVAGVPVLASNIPGNVGILGRSYPGLFPVGDTRALAQLLLHAEADTTFLACLRQRVNKLAPLYEPRRERDMWEDLLKKVDL